MRKPVIIAVLLLAFVIILALLAHRARAQDCTVDLSTCRTCGAVLLCGTASASACPEIPASLLTAEPAITIEILPQFAGA